MKVFLMLLVALLIFSCSKSKEEKVGGQNIKPIQKKEEKGKAQNIEPIHKVFDIEKNCTVCHNLPKFEEKEKDYLSKKIDEHRKLRRITLNDDEFKKLKERILEKSKK
jgi:hypothetical protein